MKFLSVRSDICRQLPSDSTSRWTPLPLTMQFPLLGLARDFHPLDNAHAERTTKKAICCLTDCLFYIYRIIYYRLEVQITVIFHFSFFVEVIDETASITSCHIRQVVFFVFSIKFFCTFFFVINLNHVNTCITLDRTS